MGAKSEIEQIIGNAVPVKLGEFIGRAIKEVDKAGAIVTAPKKGVVYDVPDEVSRPVQELMVFEQAATYTTDRMKRFAYADAE